MVMSESDRSSTAGAVERVKLLYKGIR